jgi:hypothetical protein
MPVTLSEAVKVWAKGLPPECSASWVPRRNLDQLNYKSEEKQFKAAAQTPFGKALWSFLKRPDNVLRMLTATELGCPAVEPLSCGLVQEFGSSIDDHYNKLLIGHMLRQIMEVLGLEIDQIGQRITSVGLFATGTRFRIPGAQKQMNVSAEERAAWIEKIGDNSYRRWIRHLIERDQQATGGLQCDAMIRIAKRYGTSMPYAHPTKDRLNFEVHLKPYVPASEYDSFHADERSLHTEELKASNTSAANEVKPV